ncbi:hypothetical protein DYB28_002322 [Aphanomyces astaci]|uniref:Chromo domain-containing protein n=1 Tax=Aphanomyces astaci TaxID=112090 RepID=A0A9X8E2F3_APHAT|nr:hypothetical protein DYB28_002322 [Aphanomyces astaci]
METQQLVPPYEVTAHHACRLKMCYEGDREVTEVLGVQIAFGDGRFHVERLDKARCMDSQHQVLVKWLGLNDEESSWEPAVNLLDDIPVVFRKWAEANKEDPVMAALIKTLDFRRRGSWMVVSRRLAACLTSLMSVCYFCYLHEGPVAESQEAGDKTSTSQDRYVVQVDSDAVFASVLDGHGGWQVAEYVNKHLVNDTAALLRDVASNDPTHIASLLSSAFVATDDAMRTLLLPAFQLGFGEVNRVGACSMLAYAKEDTLVVANAGDVRAVLASIDASGGLVATPLSTDHNAKHASEQARLVADHPNESNLVMCQSREACYVKGGLQPTR